MNRQDMYTQLQEKFVYVGPEPTYPSEERDLAGPYHIDVFVQQGETGFKRLVKFYVKDLNRETEEVIFEGWNPFATPTQSFAQQVNDYIASVVSNGNAEYIKVDDINEETKRALCRFYVDENGTITEKQAIVYYDDANKTMTHKFV